MHVTSVLKKQYRADLESILFFNANQRKHSETITWVADRYGVPKIVENDDRLEVAMSSGLGIQWLFALDTNDDRLIGTIIYTRKKSALLVLFVSVREDHCIGGLCGRPFLKLVEALGGIGRRIKGISHLELIPRAPRIVQIPIS